MSERDITEFGPMQRYEADDSDEEPPVRMKMDSPLPPSPRVKFFLIVAGVVTFFALLVTIIALSIGAASFQKTSQPVQATSNALPQSNGYSIYCGYPGVWTRIAHINMSDPTQQCPTAWRGYTTPVRSCGRPVTSRSTCAPVYFSSNGLQYNKVCGRVIGYQKGSPDGFASTGFDKTLDGIYVDGVSMTHGSPRTHIWSFGVGLYTNVTQNNNNCPCEGGRVQPSFVGPNFFCSSGNHDTHFQVQKYYDQYPLWNGGNCPNTTGCPFNSPPWFSTMLSQPTTDDIEVRICGDQSTADEDSPIQFLEIYVQ